ncbi:hypothetical protein STRDD10_00747 [Streptococcus sp. DD10]|uniref:hypothetical protein n=1 Tax=Streptococcus sp. DD10 TaxID=1777878 RepID=UPI00079BC05C|nr:hypothetical protein [Streptococcus sp. DD10]KXT74718.1 hypothetical protein STRDD10_00747 [Streptococcus sp. DD10]
MLIITHQASRELDRLRAICQAVGLRPRVLYTNFEADLETDSLSLISPLIYTSQEDEEGEPLFFNDLPVPPFWELWTTGVETYIFDGKEKRANLVFREDYQARTVERVEWFGQGQTVTMIDYYNRYGWRYKQGQVDAAGSPLLETYFNRMQDEVLVHYVKSGHLLYQKKEGRDQFFLNQETILQSALNLAFKNEDLVICMDPNLVSQLDPMEAGRLLLCVTSHDQLDDFKDKVAGIIISGDVPLKERREEFLYLTGAAIEPEVSFKAQAMVMTNSENIEGLDQLVEEFSELDFHIGALTAMGSKLTNLQGKSNVHLYPCITPQEYQQILSESSLYLDLNYENEVRRATFDALEQSLLLYGLEDRVHQESYKQLPTVYASLEELKEGIRSLLQESHGFSLALEKQQVCLHLTTKGEVEQFFKEKSGGSR